MSTPNKRKNIYSLSDDELTTFRDAVNTLKSDGTYDTFVERHHVAMMNFTLLPGETLLVTQRNAAHRGPAFLPWHRYFLRDFELALQKAAAGKDIMLPYWDWALDADEFPDPKTAPLWTDKYIGGDGTGPFDLVTDGPFTSWIVLIEDIASGALVPRSGPPGLLRRLGRDPDGLPVLPNTAEVNKVFVQTIYDAIPWREFDPPSARNVLEGWADGPGGLGVTTHNLVHTWVGGDMLPMTSPNDPVFYLNHCNVDRIWARWQRENPAAPYDPATGGPSGHNGTEEMLDLGTSGITPDSTLDYLAMGYDYDTLD